MLRTELAAGGFMTIVILVIGCGGSGGGGGVAAQTSTIRGQVASASTASTDRGSRGWMVRLAEEAFGLAKRAFADTALAGIAVQANGSSGQPVAASTDDTGAFELEGAPTGNVTVTFTRGGCQGEIVLPDVTADSTLGIRNVAFDCTGAVPASVIETFRATIVDAPASPDGDLVVCAASGGGNRTRVVEIHDAAITNAGGTPGNVSDLEAGQLIDVSGERLGVGSSSALDASNLTIVSGGNPVACSGPVPTPVVTATAVPEATATETETPTP
ncbi:MAG: hypothetical protein ACREQQ_14085 [Candidatus Binatia bacterium]